MLGIRFGADYWRSRHDILNTHFNKLQHEQVDSLAEISASANRLDRRVKEHLADHESLKSELINLRWALEHDDRVVDDPFPFIDRLLDKFFDYTVAENCQSSLPVVGSPTTVCPDCDGSGHVKCGEMDSGAPITHGCPRCDGTGACDH